MNDSIIVIVIPYIGMFITIILKFNTKIGIFSQSYGHSFLVSVLFTAWIIILKFCLFIFLVIYKAIQLVIVLFRVLY